MSSFQERIIFYDLETTGLKSTIDEKNVYARKSDPKQFY